MFVGRILTANDEPLEDNWPNRGYRQTTVNGRPFRLPACHSVYGCAHGHKVARCGSLLSTITTILALRRGGTRCNALVVHLFRLMRRGRRGHWWGRTVRAGERPVVDGHQSDVARTGTPTTSRLARALMRSSLSTLPYELLLRVLSDGSDDYTHKAKKVMSAHLLDPTNQTRLTPREAQGKVIWYESNHRSIRTTIVAFCDRHFSPLPRNDLGFVFDCYAL
jgi:hypothetical protein